MTDATAAPLSRLAPQTGAGFHLEKGQHLRVVDPQGEQVSDLVAFAREDKREWLSSGRSLDYANTIYLTAGHVLYSNRSRPMFTIVADTVGRHDFLLTPCSQRMFEIMYGHVGHHPNCHENLCRAFASAGILPEQISTTFNIFMDVTVASDGHISVNIPRSRPGDSIELRAEMDLVCALTACSAELSNNGSFKPIDYEVVT